MNNQEQLIRLRCKMELCDKCSLSEDRQRTVFGEGNSNNPLLMLIGEGPGETEQELGRPFVGKSGEKLEKILKFVGLERSEVYISNAVICRPPNNRVPLKEEMDACRWRLHAEISLVNPQLIVILGKSAMTTMLGTEFTGPLSQFFDTKEFLSFNIDGKDYNAIATYHPSFLLRSAERGYKLSLPHWEAVKDFVTHQKSLETPINSHPPKNEF